MSKTWGLLLASLLLINGCSTAGKSQTNPNNEPARLVALENLKEAQPDRRSRRRNKDDEQSPIRLEMLRDTAMSLGARSGYAYRTDQINLLLDTRRAVLDDIFDFNALLLQDNVQPPILVENSNSLTMGSPYNLRIADRNYQILRQARFVTTAAIWSDYLVMSVEQPDPPDSSLLPKNDGESEVWRENIREGWDRGFEQANQVYEANLNRLKRDYQGMMRYRILLEQKMISSPEVAQRELGVTGGGEEISINDRVLTITALPALRADVQQWEPAVTE